MRQKIYLLRYAVMIGVCVMGLSLFSPRVSAQEKRKPLPEDYIVLAGMMSEVFITDEKEPEDLQEIFDKGLTEMDEALVTLRAMKPSTENFTKLRDAILKITVSARKDMLSIKATMPAILLEFANAQEAEAVVAKMSEAEQENIAEAMAGFFVQFVECFAKYAQKEKPITDALLKIVPKYSAGITANDGAILVQYYDANADCIFIGFKTKERTLRNVTIAATLKNEAGASTRNFYFLETLDTEWQNSPCDYGFNSDTGIVGNTTVPDMTTIDVAVYSEDFSTQFTWKRGKKKNTSTKSQAVPSSATPARNSPDSSSEKRVYGPEYRPITSSY